MPPEDDNSGTSAKSPAGPEYTSLVEYPKEQGADAPASSDSPDVVDSKLDATSRPSRRLPAPRSQWQSALRRQGEIAAPARALVFPRRRRRPLPGALPDAPGGRLRHYRHASEKEALILENNLIKQYKPRYNIRLKDDKSYLSAKVTNHAWPRITVTRKIVKDGGRYFGPFGSADGLRETIDVIRKTFPLRTCSDAVFRNRSRPCIEYQIKRCLGPCVLPVDRDEYGRHLHAAQMLLEGKNLELLHELRDRMKAHA